MIFVKLDELKPGMRLGKPIYNKNGVLLYDRNTKLNMQAIVGVRNFGLMGLYILEPAEPLPPMTEDDINFERFQTMAVFSIREDLDLIAVGKKDKGLDWLCSLIMKNYGGLDRKINFVQSLRGADDFVYKHVLNVAILAAIIANQLKIPHSRVNTLIKAAILHDIGALSQRGIMTGDVLSPEERDLIRRNSQDVLGKYKEMDEEAMKIINQMQNMYCTEENGFSDALKSNVNANILYVADAYDRMTAMKSHEEPTSEVKAVRELLERSDLYDKKVVNALIKGINILYPGVCVELTNKEKGLVITANEDNIFEPIVLGFSNNTLYNLAAGDNVKISDVMKTMDNRIKLDRSLLEAYQK
ncbi:MAG: HD domain-containing protein [Eubacterium sp.]|nr:HD domain-containing protein [Eubacterium sp.]